jgi:hypothetical protein
MPASRVGSDARRGEGRRLLDGDRRPSTAAVPAIDGSGPRLAR